MARFEIIGAENGRVFRWSEFDRYILVKDSATSWRLVWDEANEGPLDPEQAAAEIDVTLVGGVITRLDYRTEAGVLLATMTGLSFSASLFEFGVNDDVDGGGVNGEALFSMLTEGRGLRIIGAAQDNDDFDNGDDITTTSFNDRVIARSGNDFMKDRGGADVYNGGSGFDQVSYDEWQWLGADRARGIVVDLADGRVRGPDGKVDRLIGIEGVHGTFLNDNLRGSSNDDNFQGDRGNDVINGRGGRDFVNYDDTEGSSGVTVNLRTGVAVDQWGTTDRLRSMEDVGGSQGDDTLTDNGKDNFFEGRDGADTLIFSGGNDAGRGGDDADTFVFQGTAFGDDFIEDFDGEAGDRIRIEGADSLDDLFIETEDEGVRINLNADSSVFLFGVSGDVTSYIVFD